MPNSLVRTQGSVRDAINAFFEQERRNGDRIQKYTLGLTDEDDLPPYVHQDYPKALYANDGEPIVVKDAAEERVKLAEGYYPSWAALLEAARAVNGEAEEEPEEAAPAKRRR